MSTTLPELVASRIVIPGPDGRPRIEIGLEAGDPAIRMFDGDGKLRIRLGLERDVDEDAQHLGPISELRLTASDDGGEAALMASYENYAGLEIKASVRDADESAAGAWIEAKEGRIEACLHGGSGRSGWSLSSGDVAARHITS